MKKFTLTIILLYAFGSFAQDNTKVYGSFASEMIFSFASIENQDYDQGNIMRWAPVLNLQGMANFDFNEYFGLFTGAAVRNVGFIYEWPQALDSNKTKYKYRTYNFGVPVGFKVGKLDKFLFFGGYEIEFPFVYKEKRFVNEEKEEKDVIWFSSRVEPVQHSLLAGIQFPYGAVLKFKYYLTNFHNRDYVAMVDGVEKKPYDFKSNIFYFSICWNLFTNWKEYEPKNMKTSVVR
ncbi:MAG: hypothetical protein MUC31_07070 [Bacteroidales bacterium]|jgi:hypothetical protein|nr:hypothetical protein [Bacteroidales bacterium]